MVVSLPLAALGPQTLANGQRVDAPGTLSLTIVRRLVDPSTSQKREPDFQARLSDNHLAEWIECFDFGLQVSREQKLRDT